MGSQPAAMLAAVLLAAVLLAAAMLVGSLLPTLRGPESSCSKSFGERCALEGLPEGVLSPNDFEQLPSTGLQLPSTTLSRCLLAKECHVAPLFAVCHLPECPMLLSKALCQNVW